MGKAAKTVVIIDDHEMMQAGMAAKLRPRWRIAGKASSLEEAKTLFAGLEEWPDLIVLDLELQRDWGLDLIGVLRRCDPGKKKNFPPVVIYSVYDDYAHIEAAFRAGAKGYVCKSQSIDDLLEAMDGAVSGKAIFPASLIHRVVEVSDQIMGLTKRERKIFIMVQRGYDNKEIAPEMDVSPRTIENSLSIIYDKIGVKNRQELKKL